MIHLFLLLLFITCLGITAAWIAENPGNVTIYWFDWRIDTSFAVLLLLALLAAVALAFALIIVRRLILTPEQFSQARQLRHYRRGLLEVTKSLAAIAASDTTAAEKYTRKAEKMLGQTPLTLLLSAQVARSQGDESKTRLLLEQMLEHEETEYLAARSLSDAASKQRQFPKALAMAQRAHELHKDTVSALAVVSLHIRLAQWQEALAALNKAARKVRMTRAQRLHHRGIVHLKQGMQLLQHRQLEAALIAARLCIRELPAFPPAAIFTADAYAANHQSDKGIKTIYAAWKYAPHPQLAETFRKLISSEPKEKQIRLTEKLARYNPDHPETMLITAETAIRHQQWEMARKALTVALSKGDSARACRMMAEVEKGDGMDFEEAARWMTRAAAAPAEASWTCHSCLHTNPEWDAHCPSCGSYDTLEWE